MSCRFKNSKLANTPGFDCIVPKITAVFNVFYQENRDFHKDHPGFSSSSGTPPNASRFFRKSSGRGAVNSRYSPDFG
jgi:hypothetical protein